MFIFAPKRSKQSNMKRMMKRMLAAILSIIGVILCISCSNSDNPEIPQVYKGVPLIILDADIGSSTDDLFAMEMLYRYEQQGRCRLLGVVVDREGEQNAVFTDVMNTYFGRGDVPIGLVRRKVKCIYMQGGVFGDAEEPDFNLAQGADFAQEFFSRWPADVDMVFSPMETGQTVEYTPEQVISDISWTDTHPIKQVYMTCNCNTGQRMWDVMPTVQAVEGDNLFTLSERGTLTVTPECATIFTPSATGNFRYQIAGDATWSAAMLDKIRTFNRIQE